MVLFPFSVFASGSGRCGRGKRDLSPEAAVGSMDSEFPFLSELEAPAFVHSFVVDGAQRDQI